MNIISPAFYESVSWRYRLRGLGSGSSSISTALRPTALNTDILQQCRSVRTRGIRIANHCSRYLQVTFKTEKMKTSIKWRLIHQLGRRRRLFKRSTRNNYFTINDAAQQVVSIPHGAFILTETETDQNGLHEECGGIPFGSTPILSVSVSVNAL